MQSKEEIQKIGAPEAAPQSTKVEPQLEDNEIKQDKGENVINQQEIPDHFYDSDLASINQKDFLSDNQPPKDQIEERKLLCKQKKLHIFKTIVRLGATIDKPARYDKIKLKYKEVPQSDIVPYPLKKSKQAEYSYPKYFSSFYLMDCEEIQYNIGKENLQIERLVTSMKRGQVAVFELEYLETSKKSGIKLREKVEVFVIGVETWLTVIDMDCDGKFMKQVLQRGQGHSRINKFDQVSFQYTIKSGKQIRKAQKYQQEPIKLQQSFIKSLPKVIWKVLNNMKSKQKVQLYLQDQIFKECEAEGYSLFLTPQDIQNNQKWQVAIEVFHFFSIDDIFMDGTLLKKTLMKGVSTSKPESSSLIYYALKFINEKKQAVYQDPCFNSDWWEDFGVLDQLGCRKNYLDDYTVSKMLKESIKRIKPAQIAQIQCRDQTLFTYGSDYQDYKKHLKIDIIPQKIAIIIRVYNFTEGKNCFNMEIDEKIEQSKRKKAVGVKLLKQGQYSKALKIFQNIASYYGSGQISQQGYNEKISALMNSILCLMKANDYLQIIKLSQEVLQHPKHGFDPNKLKIKGPMTAKVQGKLPQQQANDERQDANLVQNQVTLDKCLYRKAYALIKLGEGAKALETLEKISSPSQQSLALKKQAEKQKENYEKKSVKMFKNMFG